MRLNRFWNVLPILAVALAAAAPVPAGSVSGSVKFEGTAPSFKPIDMNADPGCAKMHTGTDTLKPEMLVLGAGNTVANVFVHVTKGVPAKDYPAPKEPAVIDQHGCHYVPHVLAVMKGQPIKILNSDGLLHNIHALPTKNKTFNMAMPGSVKESTATFTEEESMFKVKCDVHPWMGAFVAVMSHPFFAVTKADGKFDIANLPDGTYEIEAWHEKLGTKTATVTVKGGAAQANFSFSAPTGK
jgi:plastocyanin